MDSRWYYFYSWQGAGDKGQFMFGNGICKVSGVNALPIVDLQNNIAKQQNASNITIMSFTEVDEGFARYYEQAGAKDANK